MDESLLEDLLASARRAGADAADAVLAEHQALSVGVRLGNLEEVEREESRDLGLRVFFGKRQASVSGSNLSPDGLSQLVERAVAMARLAPEDKYAGLAPAELLAKAPFADLELYDASEPAAEVLEAQALAIEDAARAVKGVTNSEGGNASWNSSRWIMATTEGFIAPHRVTSYSAYASVIAGDGKTMERGGEGRSVRWRADMPPVEEMGQEAGRQAVSMLGARKIKSTTAPVIFENKIASALLRPLVGAISGSSVARGVSFLKTRLGEPVFAKGVRIYEEPHRLRGLGSAPYDDEGLPTQARDIIDDGVLTTWLLNMASAAQLNMTPTGHASRSLADPPSVGAHNLTVQPGETDLAGLIAGAGKGLLVTSMFGPSLNANTGDWSVGVSGFWFESGEIAHPVNEVTVAGNLNDLYARMIPGSDLEFRGSTNAPSLLIDKVAIAGQ
jgi:PmbA protein